MTLVVGLTGGIGSGKTAATDYFRRLGVDVVDADLAARIIMEPGRPALLAVAERYGKEILLESGELDRARLRSLVFSDPAERKWLESLTHPLIGEEILSQLGAATSPYVILDSPLLLETNQRELCSRVIVVDIPEKLQVQRASARDGNSEEQIRRIMAAQLPREKRLAGADDVLDNAGHLEDLHRQIDELHELLLLQSRQA